MSAQNATAATRLFAILGDPISQSFSPQMHNAAMQALSLDGVYVALRCSAQDCGALLAGLARAGGAGNVTVPHKTVAAGVIEHPTTAVVHTGACNTFWLEDGRICGDNTDVEGFVKAVQAGMGPLSGARVLLLGAGGAARAITAGLAGLGAARISVQARSPARADALLRIVEGTGTNLDLLPGAVTGRFDLVVNATPLGMRATDPMPVAIESLHGSPVIFDAVYKPGGTALVQRARRAGLQVMDGREMLLQQAAAAFFRWWRREAPLEVMRAVLTGGAPA